MFKSLISQEDREDTLNGLKKMLEVVSSNDFEDYQAFRQVIEDGKSSMSSEEDTVEDDSISFEFIELVCDVLEALYHNAGTTGEKVLINNITRELSDSIEFVRDEIGKKTF